MANQSRELSIAVCGHCRAKVAPTSEGTCPSCRNPFVKTTPRQEAEFAVEKKKVDQRHSASEKKGGGLLPFLAGGLFILILYAIGNSFEGGPRGAFESDKALLVLILIILPIAGLARYFLGKGIDNFFEDKK